MLELIQNIDQLIENLKTVEYYLTDGTTDEITIMGDLISNG